MIKLRPPTRYTIYDNGNNCKLLFSMLYNEFSIDHEPTTVKHPQVNAILEHLHGELGNMLHTAELKGENDFDSTGRRQFIIDAAWAVCLAHHTRWDSLPRVAVFG